MTSSRIVGSSPLSQASKKLSSILVDIATDSTYKNNFRDQYCRNKGLSTAEGGR